MKIHKTEFSAIFTAFLLATVAFTPVVYPSQANSQASASSSSINSLSTSAVGSSSASTTITAAPINPTITVAQYNQLIECANVYMKKIDSADVTPTNIDNHLRALKFLERAYEAKCACEPNHYPEREELNPAALGFLMTVKATDFFEQNNFSEALFYYKRAYALIKSDPESQPELQIKLPQLIEKEFEAMFALFEQNKPETALLYLEHLYDLCQNEPKNLDKYIAAFYYLGTKLAERDNKAMPFYMRAYDLSKKSSNPDQKVQLQITKEIGKILFQQDNYKEALPYLEQAHEIFEKFDKTSQMHKEYKLIDDFVACLLGIIYYEGTGNGTDNEDNLNDQKSFKFLMQAYQSNGKEAFSIKMHAASYLGHLCLDDLGQAVDLIQARSYFHEALKLTPKTKGLTLPAAIRATTGLFFTASLQLEQFDDVYKILQDNPTDDLIKQAHTLLAEADRTKCMLHGPSFTQLRNIIAENQEKLRKLSIQFQQECRKKDRQNKATKKASYRIQDKPDEALERKRMAEIQALEKATQEAAEKKSAIENKATLQAKIKEADAELEAYRNKPSDDRYQRAETLYRESFPLSRQEPAIRKHIRQQLNILEKIYEHHIKVSDFSENCEKKEEKRNLQQVAPRTLLYHHDIEHLQEWRQKAQTRLHELAANPLQVLQTEKFQALSQACSTRCGSGDRIIYVVLPQHRVGIINIGPHSDYEKVELLRHREDWFLNPTPQAITIAIERAKKRNDEEQVKALTDFLQQIRAQGSSTDSKEAKEQKS